MNSGGVRSRCLAFAVAVTVPMCLIGVASPIAIATPRLVGTMAPSSDLEGLDGRLDALERYRGSVVVVNFWATSCSPGVEQMPSLERLYREQKASGVVVLGIDQDGSLDAVRAFAQKEHLTFPILLDPAGQFAKAYDVIGIPTTVIANRNGRVVTSLLGLRTLAQMREAVGQALHAL